jgi:hypothetical protein
LAAFLSVRASAAVVVETGGAVAPAAPVSAAAGAMLGAGASLSPITAVPGASVLAPSLNTGAVIKAFSNDTAAAPAGAVRFAPAGLPALPASAAAADAKPASKSDGSAAAAPASARRDLVPPTSTPGAASFRAVTADRELAPSFEAAGKIDRVAPEGAAALGRRVFDRAADRALLADASALDSDAPVPAAVSVSVADGSIGEIDREAALARASAFTSDGEALRDAVGAPATTAGLSFRAPGAPGAFGAEPARGGAALGGTWASGSFAAPGSVRSAGAAAAPTSLTRLSLELGSGLVVKVRAALGLESAAEAARPSAAPAAAAAPARARRVPLTSTEWLERRGLLETLSVSEAFAAQTALAAPTAAPATAVSPLPALVLDPAAPARVSPLAWWAIAFLPAGLVLLKELI